MALFEHPLRLLQEENNQQCDVFTGFSGKCILIGITALAFVSYISIYTYRRKTGKEKRHPIIFTLDILKIGIGQGFAWGINLINTHRNSTEMFDPLSWYFPTFLNDEIIAVPLGVVIGKLVNKLARHSQAAAPLHYFGKYAPEQDNARWGRLIDSHQDTEVQPLWYPSWFGIQLTVWCLCVISSRLIGGLVVPIVNYYLQESSIYYLIAQWIYELEWSCATKRWFFVGFLRVLIDILQIALVDFFNKFRKKDQLPEGVTMRV